MLKGFRLCQDGGLGNVNRVRQNCSGSADI